MFINNSKLKNNFCIEIIGYMGGGIKFVLTETFLNVK